MIFMWAGRSCNCFRTTPGWPTHGGSWRSIGRRSPWPRRRGRPWPWQLCCHTSCHWLDCGLTTCVAVLLCSAMFCNVLLSTTCWSSIQLNPTQFVQFTCDMCGTYALQLRKKLSKFWIIWKLEVSPVLVTLCCHDRSCKWCQDPWNEKVLGNIRHMRVSSTSLIVIECLGRCRKRWRLRHSCCFGFPKRTLLGMWPKQERRARHISLSKLRQSASITFSGLRWIRLNVGVSLDVPCIVIPMSFLLQIFALICNLKVGLPLKGSEKYHPNSYNVAQTLPT